MNAAAAACRSRAVAGIAGTLCRRARWCFLLIAGKEFAERVHSRPRRRLDVRFRSREASLKRGELLRMTQQRIAQERQHRSVVIEQRCESGGLRCAKRCPCTPCGLELRRSQRMPCPEERSELFGLHRPE